MSARRGKFQIGMLGGGCGCGQHDPDEDCPEIELPPEFCFDAGDELRHDFKDRSRDYAEGSLFAALAEDAKRMREERLWGYNKHVI